MSPDAKSDARFWNTRARGYAKSKIQDMAGYERTLERTRAHLSAGATVLELGCGTGTTAIKLAPSVGRLVATDISSEMIAIGGEKAAEAGVGNVEFRAAPSTAVLGPDGGYDAVLAFNLLHLVEDRAALYADVRRLLKPGGVFISKTPCIAEMSSPLLFVLPLMQAIGQAPYVARFTAAEFEREIEVAGFSIAVRERHGSGKKDGRIFLVARPA